MTRGEAPYMLSRRRGLQTMTAVVVYGIGLILTFAPGLAETKNRHAVELEIRKRKVTTVTKTIRFTEGEEVRISWTTDEKVDLHLHGYDIRVTAKPGQPASMNFKAHTAGRFPISAHNFGHSTLIYLEVYPR